LERATRFSVARSGREGVPSLRPWRALALSVMARSVPQARDVAIPSSVGERWPVLREGVRSWGDCFVGPPGLLAMTRWERSAPPTAPWRAPGVRGSLRSGPGGPSLGTPFGSG